MSDDVSSIWLKHDAREVGHWVAPENWPKVAQDVANKRSYASAKCVLERGPSAC
jgi:hypothetical protein